MKKHLPQKINKRFCKLLFLCFDNENLVGFEMNGPFFSFQILFIPKKKGEIKIKFVEIFFFFSNK